MIKPRTLNHALALLLALVSVPLLLGALALLVVQVRHSQELQQTQLTALAQTLAKAVENDFEHRKAQLEVMASSKIIERRDWQGLDLLGRTLAKQRPGSVLFLMTPNGEQLVNTTVPFGQPLPNPWLQPKKEVVWDGKSLPLSVADLTKTAFRTGQVGYSDLYIGMVLHEPRMALVVPVVRDQQVLFVLGVSFSPKDVQKLIDSAVSVPGIRASVTDRLWNTVASNAASSSRTGDKVQPFAIDEGRRAGSFELLAADGVPVHGAYALTNPSGFVVRTSVPLRGLMSSLRDASPGWLVLALSAILLSAMLMGLISRRFARPLRELHWAARDGRAPDGTLTGIEEIDMIAQALRAGVQAEEQRREEMALNLQRQLSENALRKSNREKDEFLATLAHELRNPLAPIMTAAAVIGRQHIQNPSVAKARDIIERQAIHMARLVDDLLDISRVTLGSVTLQTEALDLNELARQATDLVRSQTEAAHLRLTLTTAEAPVMIQGDAVRLAQCLSNLLHNALKFTPGGGCINLKVSVDADTQTAHVLVRDNGAGIAPDNLERIFEVFVQSAVSGSQGYSGLGIGLALARKLITLHHGTIHAHSAGLGQGSVFTICLPLLTPLPEPAVMPCVADLAAQSPTPASAQQVGQPSALTSGPSTPPESAPMVLVVDDNEDAANMLSEVITLSGFRTQSVFTGESALQAMADCMPAAVLLDIGLPDISGYEVCKRLRARPGVTQPLVIAVTGWGQAKDRAESLAVGFDAHLTKPTDPQVILNLLERTLHGQPA